MKTKYEPFNGNGRYFEENTFEKFANLLMLIPIISNFIYLFYLCVRSREKIYSRKELSQKICNDALGREDLIKAIRK